MKRHDVLRTFFDDLYGAPRQFIADKLELPLTITDASSNKGSDLETHVHQLLNTRLQEPFSLQQPPLFRIEAIKLASDDHLLF